jgi:mRNA-degrading endonuclease RelE of RelBE toxin-antitoxin system
VEFLESQPFYRKLHRLAGDDADEVLIAIQRDLAAKPDRGAMVPGLGGVRKARVANPGRGKGKRGGYRYLYLYLETRRHIHLRSCSTKTNKKMPAKSSASRFASGLPKLNENQEIKNGEENQDKHF